MENKDIYKTSDFYMAVMLKTLGINIVNAKKGVSGRIVFEFADKKKCEESVLKFTNGKMVLPYNEVIINIKKFQRLVHNY
jgi:hypothetical protein